MPFCHKCGAKLVDDSEYCSKCGAKVSSNPGKEPKSRKEDKKSAASFSNKKIALFGWGFVGLVIVFSLIAYVYFASTTVSTIKPNELKPTCSNECVGDFNYCEGDSVYGCYDANSDGCKEKHFVNTCSQDENCVGGDCIGKPAELELSANYDSCLIKKEYTSGSGITIVQGDTIQGLDYYDERGGISAIEFEVTLGKLNREDEYEIETKMFDSAGRTKFTNSGKFSMSSIYSTSDCDKCYGIPQWISLPYEPNGHFSVKITSPDGKLFEKTVYIDQEDCITKKIVSLFDDLFECSNSNKVTGDACTCFEDRCISHRVADGGYYPNSNGYLTLIPGDFADKDKIINELNVRNFDFRFDMVNNALPGFMCEGSELSATKQRDMYLMAEYYIDENDVVAQGYNYHIFCQESDRD